MAVSRTAEAFGHDPGNPGEWPYEQPTWIFSRRELAGVPGADVRFVRGDVRPVHEAMRNAVRCELPMLEDLTLQHRRALRSIAKPLGFIFWGAVLTVADIRFAVRLSGKGFAVDLLPDWLGLGLIGVGMGMLAFSGLLSSVDDTAVTISGAVFFTLCLFSIAEWFVPQLGQLPTSVTVLLDLVAAAAVVGFCVAMARLASRLGLPSVARWWALIAVAMVALYTMPQLLVVLVPSLAPVILVAAAALVIGLGVAFLRTAHHMRRVARDSIPPARQRSGAV